MNESGYAAHKECLGYQCKSPTINDTNLKLEVVYQGNYTSGLEEFNQLSPVSKMEFLGYNDIILLNKIDGKLLRIQNNTLLPEQLLDVNVTNKWESGLLGIAISREGGKIYVFLYYTEAKNGDGSYLCPSTNCVISAEPSYNKLYRYELQNDRLINPKLLFTVPSPNHYSHIGGELEIGPDNNLYLTLGDIHGDQNKTTSTMAQNSKNGTFPDGRAGILRFTQDGRWVGDGILGRKYPLNLYYAYGIRNSYGLDFDPVSGKLWDTENGPEYGDETNLVEPGFNSGWSIVQGIWLSRNSSHIGKLAPEEPEGLVNFGGKGKYSAPELVWNNTVAPTALKFLNSNKLGEEYENDLFVASFNFGEIYHFDLNEDRTQLDLHGPLDDKVANNQSELQDVIFARGLGKITDLDVGPDGNLYVLSNYFDRPTIFKISSVNETKSIQ